jgi:hypothetical protein
MKKSKQPKTHFVPRVVFEAAFVGVVPICVAATACGGNGGNDEDASADARSDTLVLSVANIGFDGGVADIAFDGGVGDARDAANRDAPIFSVAFIGFDGGVADIAFDGGVADSAFRVPDASDAADAQDSDATFAVADSAFRPPD